MAETIETEATPIEEGLAKTSGLDLLVASITSEAERLAKEYLPREITDEDGFKQSKRERSGARKDIAELKGRYDAQMRTFKEAIRDADARVKAALEPLSLIDSGYKEQVDAYEARWKSQRLADLAVAYGDYAPDLADLVPFERLRARFGNEKGKQWDARSLTDAQAEMAMEQAVQVVANDERTIDAAPYEDEDRAALKADYFQTLDLAGSLRRTQEAKEQRERVARLERERQERQRLAEEAMQAKSEPRPEPEPPKPIIDTHTQMTPEEYRQELAAMSALTGGQERPEPITSHQRTVRTITGAQTVLVALYSMTSEQMRRLAGTLSAQGIHGKPKGTGMLLSEAQCADLLTFATTRAQGYDAPKARKEL